ncbi:hypothetical protein DSECCO2_605270 [anaerobic digester metagenome]
MTHLAFQKGDPVVTVQFHGRDEDVLVAAPRDVDDHDLVPGQGRGQFHGPGHGVGRFQGRDDALQPGQALECVQGLHVGDRRELDDLAVIEPGQLGTHAGVVEAGRDRMGVLQLAALVLQKIALVALHDADLGRGPEAGGIVAHGRAAAAGLGAVEADAWFLQKRMEKADGVGTAAHAGHQVVGQPALALHELCAHLAADDGLEVADHDRVREGPQGRTQDVVRVLQVLDPVFQRRVDRVLQGLRTVGDGHDLGP